MLRFMILETALGRSAGAPAQGGPRRARQKQRLALLAVVLLFLVSLAGCGGVAHPPIPTSQPTTIVFTSTRALGGSNAANTNAIENIWVMKSDGTGAPPLTKLTAAGVISFGFVWSPDGSKIAFTSRRALDGGDAVDANFVFNIWVVKSDGTGATPLTRLTASGADSVTCVWSPDGSKIAFDSERALDGSDAANSNGVNNIWVMNALDGSGATPLTKLTASGALSFVTVWSPDGGRLGFQSQRALDGSDAANTNRTENIWVMKSDGSGAIPLTKLTAFKANSGGLVWSPDGNKIVFDSGRALDGSDAANTNSVSNIWVMSPDGSAAVPLTKLSAANADSSSPGWKP